MHLGLSSPEQCIGIPAYQKLLLTKNLYPKGLQMEATYHPVMTCHATHVGRHSGPFMDVHKINITYEDQAYFQARHRAQNPMMTHQQLT